MKKQLLILSVSLFLGANSFAQKRVKGPLDGRIYSITLTEEGKKKPEEIKDDVSLINGKLKSNFMTQASFLQTDYQFEIDSTEETPTIKFTAESKTESQQRFSWEGTVDGDDVTGTAVIHKKGKVVHSYSFTGTQKNKRKAKPAAKTASSQPAAGSEKEN